MKKIGLIGGTGPESTLMYYKELNTRIDRLTNGREMPDMAIESVNFHRAWEYVTTGQYESLTNYLAEKANHLLDGGAQVISLTAATMHVVYDELSEKVNAELVSIPKAVCKEAVLRNYKKVGLLGTIFTMEQDYMKKDLCEAGIQVYIPEKKDRKFIAEKIYEELERGIVKEGTFLAFKDIIEKMKNEHGIEAIILGCTELPLLLNPENCPIPCMDAIEIHINELITRARA
jgi:aspartate racemase